MPKIKLPEKEMDALEFQRTVLGGVNALEEKVETHVTGVQKLLEDPERLPKQLKDDMTKLKTFANDVTKALAQLQKIQTQLRQEAISSFGNPIARIERNPQLRGMFNMLIRAATAGPQGNLDNVVKEIADSLELKISSATLRAINARSPEMPIARAIGEDTGEGATLIIAQLYKEIYDTLAEYGQWATLGVRRVGTKVTNFPVKTARPVANFLTSEGAAISDDTNYAGNTVTQTVLPIAVLLLVSKQLLEDAEFDVTALVMNDFTEAHNLRLDNACFVGTGAGGAADGNFTGLFNGGTAVVAGAGGVQANLTKYDDWAKLLTSVAPVVLAKRNPQFWMHPFMLIRAMQVKDSNGRPIFLGALEGPKLNRGSIGSILGFPVETCMAAPNVNSASQPVCAFGDPDGQVVAIRDDFVFEFSDHYAWNTLQRAFRGYSRAATGTRRSDAFAILQTSAN
jgi:HK97 family phage major capsid protein